MKVAKYFIYCISFLFLFYLAACHLGGKDQPPPAPQPGLNPNPVLKPDPKPEIKSLVWSGSLEITDSGRYRNLLRDYKKCDPCSYYTGPLECENYDSRADVEISFDKNDELPAKATVKIRPYHSYRDVFPIEGYFGLCGQILQGDIKLKGTAKYLNDYEGFHVRFEGSSGVSYIDIRSDSTNPIENGVLDIILYYGGSARQDTEFGRAELENAEMEDLNPGRIGGR